MATTTPVPILVYHRVVDGRLVTPQPALADPHYTISLDAFARQMQALADHGFAAVSLASLLPGGRPITVPKPVVITFDDGYLTDLRVARPLLDVMGWPSEHFITTDWVGTTGFMTWDDLKKLIDTGQGVQSHSVSHAHFDRLRPEAVRFELVESRARLQAKLSRRIDFIALPGGHGATHGVRQLVKSAGYRGLCTSLVGRNTESSSPYALRRIPITQPMTPETVARLADGIGIARMTLVRSTFTAARRMLGPTLYDAWRARLLRQGLMN